MRSNHDGPAGSHRKNDGGVLLALIAYAAFSCSDAAIRLLHGRVGSFELAFIGALLGIAALPVVKEAGDDWADLVRIRHWPAWLARAGTTSISTVTSVVAFTLLPMPEAFALIFLMPFFITVGSVLFLHERVGAWRWAVVAIGFVGVMVVLRPGFRVLGWGHVAAIAAGLSSALSVLIVRRAGARERPLTLYGAGLIGPLVVNGLLMLPTASLPPMDAVPLILVYGLLAAMGQALLLLAAHRADTSRIASPQYSQMLWAVLFSVLIFQERTDRLVLIGAGIIIFAGAIAWSTEGRKLAA